MYDKVETIPEKVLKYCPRCGSGLFRYQKDYSFLCNECGFHFYINSAAAVAAVIVNDKGEMLLSKRAFDPHKGMLDLPGGFVDPQESAENALKREIKEELNLDVNHYQYLISAPNEYVFSGFSVYTNDMGFLCHIKDFSTITHRDDISDYFFVKPADIDYEKICSDSIKSIIKTYISLSCKQE
ncbi:NUDIX domain-containing protein [Marinilabiliaceae bacterium ANBcel2]|nr:NUDIX domain-containing protein [Marinilabiliaceae bacterium ANBcel2]